MAMRNLIFHFLLGLSLIFSSISDGLAQYYENYIWKDSSQYVTNLRNSGDVRLKVPFSDLLPSDSNLIQFESMRLFGEFSTGPVNRLGTCTFNSTLICDVFLTGTGHFPEQRIYSGLNLFINQNGHAVVEEVVSQNLLQRIKQFSAITDTTPIIRRRFTHINFRLRTLSTSVTCGGGLTVANVEAQHLSLKIWYELKAKVNVSTLQLERTNPISEASGDGREKVFKPLVGFGWKLSKPFPVPAYRFQLLKLENQADPSPAFWQNGFLSADEKKIFSNGKLVLIENLDWSKALEVRVDGNNRTLPLTLNAGSGFYVWRVQAVGNFDGLPFTKLNASAWSPISVSTFYANDFVTNKNNVKFYKVALKPDMRPLPELLYFEDPDSSINRMHARVFQEGDRQKEVIQYANGLDKEVQVQTYLPSESSVLSSGSAYDYSGRKVVESLPSPTKSQAGLQGYKKGLLKPSQNSTGRTLNPEHFDNGNQVKNQPTVETGSGSSWEYYEKETGVAKTGGAPIKRSVFKNGSVDKVVETGGFGPEFAVKPGGKTVKNLYSTPSQTELDQLFGKLAPKAEKIQKVINIDQNGTSTSSFITPEGKTIATSLGFYDTLKFDKPFDAVLDTTVDPVAENRMEGGLLMSSRQVSFNRRSIFGANYLFRCKDFSVGCFRVEVDRTYEVEVTLKKTDGRRMTLRQTGQPLGEETDVDLKGFNWTLEDTSTLKIITQDVRCDSVKPLNLGLVELPAGTYQVYKVLRPKNNPSVTIQQVDNEVSEQTQLFVDAVTRWGKEMECNFNPENFVRNLRHVSDSLKEIKADYPSGVLNPAGEQRLRNLSTFLLGRDTTYFTIEHSLDLFPNSLTPNFMIFRSSCCNLSAPIRFSTAFNCENAGYDKTDNEVLQRFSFDQTGTSTAADVYLVNPYVGRHPELTEITPDLEGFAFEYFWDCVNDSDKDTSRYNSASVAGQAFAAQIDTIDQHLRFVRIKNGDRWKVRKIWDMFLKPSMGGYRLVGTFNLMVNKMVKDTIACDGIGRRYLVDTAGKAIIDTSISPSRQVVEEFAIHESPDSVWNSCQKKNLSICSNTFQVINQAAFDNYGTRSHTKLDTIQAGGCKSYDCNTLFNCWLTQLNYVKNQMKCGITAGTSQQPSFNTGGPGTSGSGGSNGTSFGSGGGSLSNAFDEENNGETKQHDNHFGDNVNFKKPWYMFRKRYNRIKRRIKETIANIVRQSQGQPASAGSPNNPGTANNVICNPSDPDETDSDGQNEENPPADATPDVDQGGQSDGECNEDNCETDPDCANCANCELPDNSDKSPAVRPLVGFHLVYEFLNCTGRRLAKILTNDDPFPFNRDIENSQTYFVPDFQGYTLPLYNINPGSLGMAAGGLAYYEGKPRGYNQLGRQWHGKNQISSGNPFPYVMDPVYAYKYFEYIIDLFPELEIQTCFRNPNMERNGPNNYSYILSAPDTIVRYCELETGKICLGKMKEWSCSQRFAFYKSLTTYQLPDTDMIFRAIPEQMSTRSFLAPGIISTQSMVGYDTMVVRTVSRFENYTNGVFGPRLVSNWNLGRWFRIAGRIKKQKRMLFIPYESNLYSTYVYNQYYPSTRRRRLVRVREGDNSFSFLNLRRLSSFPIGNQYGAIFKDGMVEKVKFVNLTLTADTLKSFVELALNQANHKVKTRCEQDRDKIRQMLGYRFVAQGFVIRDCITQCDSVVTPTDLDRLTDAYVKACAERGMVNTFTVDSTGCRSVMTRYEHKGLKDFWGAISAVPEIYLGSADTGTTDFASCDCQRAVMYAQDTLVNLAPLNQPLQYVSGTLPQWNKFNEWNSTQLDFQRSREPSQFKVYNVNGSPKKLSTWVNGTRVPIFECKSKNNRQALRMKEVLFGYNFVTAAKVLNTQTRYWTGSSGNTSTDMAQDNCDKPQPKPCPTCVTKEGFTPTLGNAEESALPSQGTTSPPGAPQSVWTSEQMVLDVKVDFRDKGKTPAPQIISRKTISKNK